MLCAPTPARRACSAQGSSETDSPTTPGCRRRGTLKGNRWHTARASSLEIRYLGAMQTPSMPSRLGRRYAATVSPTGFGVIQRTARSMLVASASCLTVMSTASFAQPTIREISVPGASQSRTIGVSGDGSVVLGFATLSYYTPFLWSETNGIEFLPDFIPSAISDDGSTVVGEAASQAVRWTASTGVQGLGTLSCSADVLSRSKAVSADGAVVVGYCFARPSPTEVCRLASFRWTQAAGMYSLGGQFPTVASQALGLSGDGTQVVHGLDSGWPNYYRYAIYWTAEPSAPIGWYPSPHEGNYFADGLSLDGQVLLGSVENQHGRFGFRRKNGTQTFLPFVPRSCNSDGTAIISSSARLWTSTLGTVDFRSHLQAMGLDLAGWHFYTLNQISSDGTAIVGDATRGTSVTPVGFIIKLPCPITDYPSISAPPLVAGCDFGSISASVNVLGTESYAFQWQWQPADAIGTWRNIDEGSNTDSIGVPRFVAEGVTSATIAFRRDSGGQGTLQVISAIRCVVDGSCARVYSQPIVLAIRDCPYGQCPADYDGSGGTPDAGDVDSFFADWLAGAECADADCSGGTPDAGDVDAFFAQWLAGGC